VEKCQKYFTLLFALTFLLPHAYAQAKLAPGFLPKKFSASFEQSYKSNLTGKVKRSWGKIQYEYPSRLRFVVDKPQKLIFVSNPKKTWYYTAPLIPGEKGDLSVSKTKKIVLSELFDALYDKSQKNDVFKLKNNSPTIVQLEFLPQKVKDIGIESAKLVFKNKKDKDSFSNVQRIEIIDSTKKVVTLVFNDLKSIKKFPKDNFLFSEPE
jgi:outer membrane lipoprotein-sorting protein